MLDLTTATIHCIDGHLLTGDEIGAMGFWLADYPGSGVDNDDVADMPRAAVVRGVERHYPGGVRTFLAEMEV